MKRFIEVLEIEINIAEKNAHSHMQSGDQDQAQHLLHRLFLKVNKFSDKYSADLNKTAWLLRCIVSVQSQINDIYGARETISSINHLYSDKINLKKIYAMTDIAKAELRIFDRSKANHTLCEAKDSISLIKDIELQAVGLLSVAETQREGGFYKASTSTYFQAFQAALHINDTTERTEALTIIANGYFDLGLKDFILTLVDADLTAKQELLFNLMHTCIESKNRSMLKQLMPYFAGNIDLCINFISALAVLYSQQATALYQIICAEEHASNNISLI